MVLCIREQDLGLDPIYDSRLLNAIDHGGRLVADPEWPPKPRRKSRNRKLIRSPEEDEQYGR